MKRVWLILAALLGLAVTAVPASANIQWTLNQGGSLDPTNASAPYGTVTAAQIGTGSSAYVEVTISLTVNPPAANYFIATGNGTHAGIVWNMSVVPDALSIVSSVAPHSDPTQFTPQALNGSYTDPPFSNSGNFQYAITPIAGSGGAGTESSIVFDLTKAGGLSLTTGLFTPNNGGYYWAVDIGLNCTTSANGKKDCGEPSRTGVVAASAYVQQLPEPGTWTMSIAVWLV